MTDNLYRNINGRLRQGSDYTSADPGIRSSYGLYETILYCNGRLQRAGLHWERLLKGLPQLDFRVPENYTPDFFETAIANLLEANQLAGAARVRVQVLVEPALPEPFFYIESFPLDSSIARYNDEGLHIGILEVYKKPLRPESNLKLSHNGHAALAAEIMQQQGWDDVLLLNDKDNICESAIANLFVVKKGQIITPPLSEGCLAGTMRAWLIPRLQEAGYPVLEAPVTRQILLGADEIFLTNSIRPLRWVGQIAEHKMDHVISSRIWQQIFSPALY